MRRFAIWLLLIIASHPGLASASESSPVPPGQADNAVLKKILDADQTDRQGDAFRNEPEAVKARDRQRRDTVLQMVKDGSLHTARDYFSAAMVFQHSADDIRLAHSLATIAGYLDPENKQYRWLMAASWDRMLMQRVQPQWYGTQYQGDERGMFLFPIAGGAVTDAERADMGVPALDESRSRLVEIAAMVGQKVRPEPPTIEELQGKSRPSPNKNSSPTHSGKEEK